jgi:ATP-binding cassette, subfamily F, member 3
MILLEVEGVRKHFGPEPVLDGVTFDVRPGDRIGLVGPNGCGKTTLLRCLLGLVTPDDGQINLGQGVTVGYFDQQLAELNDDMDVVDAVRPKHKQMNQQERRNLLAGFGLTGDTALQKVGSLSGGERCRAALARLSAADANFLILDEPTNHLDLWARDALEKALTKFNGTVLMVSHDRYFVNRVADHLLVIDANQVRLIEGNYDTYQTLLQCKADEAVETAKEAARSQTPPPSPAKSKKESKKSPSKRRFPFRKVRDIEDEIFERETSVQAMQLELTEPSVLRNGDRVREIKQQIEREQEAIKGLYEHWEEASEKNW